MTGPIIPADQWPDTVVAKLWTSAGACWDLAPFAGGWGMGVSSTPMPTGHDWRVPVMRQPPPTIDAANARRLYHHVVNGGSLSKDDVGRLVVAIETRDGALQAQPAPAIDLGQFRKSVDAAWACGAIELAEAKRLLALIDAHKGE